MSIFPARSSASASRKGKGKGSDPIAILVLSFLGIIILFATAIATLALIGGWLYLEWRMKHLPPTLDGVASTHTSVESSQLKILGAERRKLQQRVEVLEGEATGLNRRRDGQFDERSAAGRRLNVEMPRALQKFEYVQSRHSELEEAPDNRLRQWISIRASLVASRIAVGALPVLTIIAVLAKTSGVESVSSVVENNVGGPLLGISSLYGAWSAAVVTSCIMFVVVNIIVKATIRRSTNQ